MLPVCATCGVQFGAPAERCRICEDPRQYVPPAGQRWTSVDELARDHHNEVREEAGLVGIGTEPRFAIGQSDNRPTITIAVQQVATSASLEVVRERSNVGERVQQSIFETLIDRNLKSRLEPIPGLA